MWIWRTDCKTRTEGLYQVSWAKGKIYWPTEVTLHRKLCLTKEELQTKQLSSLCVDVYTQTFPLSVIARVVVAHGGLSVLPASSQHEQCCQLPKKGENFCQSPKQVGKLLPIPKAEEKLEIPKAGGKCVVQGGPLALLIATPLFRSMFLSTKKLRATWRY